MCKRETPNIFPEIFSPELRVNKDKHTLCESSASECHVMKAGILWAEYYGRFFVCFAFCIFCNKTDFFGHAQYCPWF